MHKIIYRDLKRYDYDTAKFLIGDAFGFNEFISDKKFLDQLLNIYLQDCILSSSFGKVAEKDNKVIGLILGDAKNDKTHLRKFHNFTSIASTMLKFLVSKESRGLGVGKALISQTFDYMKDFNVESLYLYTDTRCNYGFYDSQNFKRLNEKKVYFDSPNDSLDIFLYSYKL